MQRPTGRHWKLAAGTAVVAFAGLAGYRHFAPAESQLERDLDELRGMGVPTSLEELREREEGGVPIKEVRARVERLRAHPAYVLWTRASRDEPGKVGVTNSREASKCLKEMDSEFGELRTLLRDSEGKISWDWPDGVGWDREKMLQFTDAGRLVGISRRRMATEFASGDVEAGLESALDVQMLAEQMFQIPGLTMGTMVTMYHSHAMQGFANAMELGADNPQILAKIDEATEQESPGFDLRVMLFDGLVWAREEFDKPKAGEIAKQARRDGPKGAAEQLSSEDPEMEAEIVGKFLAAHKQLVPTHDVLEFEKALGDIGVELRKDPTPSGRLVAKFWLDPSDPDNAKVFAAINTEKTRWALARAALKVLQSRLKNGRLPESLEGLDVPVDPVTKKALSYRLIEQGFELRGPDGQTLAFDLGSLPRVL